MPASSAAFSEDAVTFSGVQSVRWPEPSARAGSVPPSLPPPVTTARTTKISTSPTTTAMISGIARRAPDLPVCCPYVTCVPLL